MKNFSDLKKNLKKDFNSFKAIKIALLGDNATQFLAQSIRGMGFESKLDLQVWEADFNQLDLQIMDFDSEFYERNAEIVMLFETSHKLLNKFNKLDLVAKENFAKNQIQHLKLWMQTIAQKINCKIIYFNLAEINDAVFGNFGNKVKSSFVYQQRLFNSMLMDLAIENPNLNIVDLASIQNRVGRNVLYSPSIYVNTEMELSIDVLPDVAHQIVSMIAAMNGKVKKCLILDLDNTTWGGIIGDDGIENIQIGMLGIGKAFTELQYWAKALQQRGIILAVCSKNNEDNAKEPFEKHPDMVLHLEDIAVFVANWENKADNIRHIQSVLNIGFDSMVFLDDNPFERNLVRENLPDVFVPELPEDPAEYLPYLYAQNLFETTSFSNEDIERTKLYQVEAQRTVFQQNFTNEEDFLKSLNMVSVVESFNKFNTPRVSQLSQRSNQFNLRTVRYTEDDIKRISTDENYFTLSFTLEDKFGDNGLICAIILKKENADTLFIDTWFMSCRVLKRGMENFTLNKIVEIAKANCCKIVKGEYIPSAKNGMVKAHYQNLGFVETTENNWELNIGNYADKNVHITKK